MMEKLIFLPRELRKKLNFFIVILVFLYCFELTLVSSQNVRRPSGGNSTPALEAYRIRWISYLKKQQNSTPRPFPNQFTRPSTVRNPNFPANDQDTFLVKGFSCKKAFSLFQDENNPRMYHLCAKRHDGWYIYHYFCPHGTYFHDSMKKCMIDHNQSTAPVSSTERITESTTKVPAKVSVTTITSPPTTVPTTTLESVSQKKPDVQTTTEDDAFSSEEEFESSTEENNILEDVHVSVSHPSISSEEESLAISGTDIDNDNTSNEIKIMSGEGANKQKSRLPAKAHLNKKKPTMKNSTSSGVNADSSSAGRRPRLFK